MFKLTSTSLILKSQPNQLYVHGHNYDALHAQVSKDCLTKELGGNLPYTYDDLAGEPNNCFY